MSTQSPDYQPKILEKHWQAHWQTHHTFAAEPPSSKPKYYALDMFPYPSGDGLHIGHPEGYTATDIIARMRKSQGFNVLHPMGWDAFGLPAEQHAIKTGTHPAVNTQKNVDNFRRQLQSFGFGFDWSREVNTTDPAYFKWTQWIFLQLFKRGLAYVDEKPVWWCPNLGTVLANEEVIDGKSERGDHPVERRNLRQWVLRITAYADRLLQGLDSLDWPDSTKRMQTAWIGKSSGAEVHFKLHNHPDIDIVTFTTRADTLFGVNFLVISPEHPLVNKVTTPDNQAAVDAYVKAAASKSDLERTELAKDKSGVFSGSYAIHPLTGNPIPVWIADYVLASYGTGAVMGVPSDDPRDLAFAKKFNLPVTQVFEGEKGQEVLINSDKFNGLSSAEATHAITQHLQSLGAGKPTVNFKLRDWLFSRQRYWGEPFPILWVDEAAYNKLLTLKDSALHEFLPETPVSYQKDGQTLFAVPLPSSQLPLTLPEVDSYQPSGDAESPLANAKAWVNTILNLQTGETSPKPTSDLCVPATRETNTMPQWAGSCWYYLRYLDPKNPNAPVSPDIEKYWGSPDIYIGGAEHAVLHLLYARFWHQVLFDAGVVSTPEPFNRVVHQGLILGEPEHRMFRDDSGNPVSAEHVDREGADNRTGHILETVKVEDAHAVKKGEHFVLRENESIQLETRSFKMSKSRGNVVSVDTVINDHGADAIRLYEMFLGPLEAMKPWSTQGIEGISRFLRRVWREIINPKTGQLSEKLSDSPNADSEALLKTLHFTIRKVTEDVNALQFNTAISQLMILLNQFQSEETCSKSSAKIFLQLLAPFAPHIAEELWERLGEQPSIVNAPWPICDESKLVESKIKIIVQVNGKMRAELLVDKAISKENLFELAKSDERVTPFINDLQIVKEIYVPGRILNLVVK